MSRKSADEKLKVVMLGHKRIPSREGGVEVVVEELATRMVVLGFDVTCINRKGRHVSGKEHDQKIYNKFYKGIKIKSVITIDKKGLAAMTSSLFGAIKAALGSYDVVHFHAEGPCAMMWIPKICGKRCIATIHGLDWSSPKWKGFAKKYIKFGEKCAVKFADEIIVLSKNTQRYFDVTYARDTILIPNGVNKPEYRKADKITKQFGLEGDSYILYLGRIVQGKGIDYLIKAFTNIETNKKLVIAGGASDTNDYMKDLKKLAEQDDRIVFTGFVQGELLEELYSNAYVYTLPSDSEGMPLSLLEAMSYGNCVIGSDISEILDVVEDKAIIFKKTDIKNLQEKLQLLINEPQMVRSYKDITRDFICNKYDWNDIVTRTTKLYIGEK